MDVVIMVLVSGALLVAAYFTIGTWLSRRVFRLDNVNVTPAVEVNDGADYVPTKKSIIFGHHFTSIAGTGPIVGPAIAVMWGWLPALLWVVFGSIFVGAVHDLGSIVVSLRKKGRSIGDIAGDLLGPRARLIFLGILVVGLWLVLAVFGLVIASVLRQYPGAIFPVMVQTPLAMVVGWLIYRKGVGVAIPSVVVLALMYASVVWGDVAGIHAFNAWMSALPIWVWVVGLLVYSYIASVMPVWLLLQPRDYINALQLVSALALLVVGLGVAAVRYGGEAPGTQEASGTRHQAPAGEEGAPEPLPLGERMSASSPTGEGCSPRLLLVAPMVDWNPAGAPPIVPILFITVACGACSGFHCLVGSGTTSKQIAKERDAKAVGYGSMLTEGFLAVIVIAACAGGIGLGAHEPIFQSALGLGDERHQQLGLVEIGVRDPASVHTRTWTILTLRSGVGTTNLNNPPFMIDLEDVRGQGITVVERPMKDFNSWGVSSESVGLGTSTKIEFHYEIDGTEKAIVPTDVGVSDWLPMVDGALRQSVDTDSLELCGVLAFDTKYASWQSAGGLASTVGAFVEGGANFLTALNIPRNIAIALMAVMVASFAATTMDTSCRLQRYVVQELGRVILIGRRARHMSGGCPSCGYDLAGIDPERAITHDDAGAHPHDEAVLTRCPECGATSTAHQRESEGVVKAAIARASWWNPFKWLTTAHGATIFAVVSAGALAAIPPSGQAWSLANAGMGAMTLWPLFGCVNQLLAGFAFVVIIAWLRATGRPWWFAAVPALLMLVMPAWALVWQMAIGNAENPSWITAGKWLLVATGAIALALEAWLVTEAAVRWRKVPAIE